MPPPSRWWRQRAAASPRLAQWLDDAHEDGFDRLYAVGVNDVDWWLDALRLDPKARRRYRLDSDSELEWLLLHWPPRLRTSESPTSAAGYVVAEP